LKLLTIYNGFGTAAASMLQQYNE